MMSHVGVGSLSVWLGTFVCIIYVQKVLVVFCMACRSVPPLSDGTCPVFVVLPSTPDLA